MADSKITAMTELASGNVAADDWLEIVDKSNTTDDPAGSSRKALVSSVITAGLGSVASLTLRDDGNDFDAVIVADGTQSTVKFDCGLQFGNVGADDYFLIQNNLLEFSNEFGELFFVVGGSGISMSMTYGESGQEAKFGAESDRSYFNLTSPNGGSQSALSVTDADFTISGDFPVRITSGLVVESGVVIVPPSSDPLVAGAIWWNGSAFARSAG